MKLTRWIITSLVGLSAMTAIAEVSVPKLPGSGQLGKKARLGQLLFFDTSLSEPAGQACVSCHDPAKAFTDKDKTRPTSKGVIPGLHGNRNTPTAMYSAFAPAFHFSRSDGLFIGGQFLDGRASTLADQAKGPFINPIEMANPDSATVVEKVRNAEYAAMFDSVYGPDALSDTTQAYNRIADAIAAFERSPVLNRFTSKYDLYLFGRAKLTSQERRGLIVFEAGDKGNCAACHPNRPVNGIPPLFTDHSYDNLGVPKNPANLFYSLDSQFNPDGAQFVDLGLGASLSTLLEDDPNKFPTSRDNADAATELQDGKIKVPTLRNVAITGPYMHNGYFKTLPGLVSFYSNRDNRRRCPNPLTSEARALAQKCWPSPEVEANVNHAELGSLNLTIREIDDLVAFLKTLTDGYASESPWKVTTP